LVPPGIGHGISGSTYLSSNEKETTLSSEKFCNVVIPAERTLAALGNSGWNGLSENSVHVRMGG